MTSRRRGTILVLLCVTLWALIPVVAKLGQVTLDSHQFLFWSSLISFLVLSSTAIIKGDAHEVKRYSFVDWFYLSFLGLLGTYVYYLFLYLGYSETNGLEVLVIQYTWPVLILLLSLFILKEKLTKAKSIAIILGFIGVLLVLSKGDFSQINLTNPTVIALVGAGSFCFALYSVLNKRVKQSPLTATSVYFFAATLASLISMFYFSEFTLPSKNEWLPVLLNGIFVNGFSYLFWMMALKTEEASFLAPFTFLTPVLSAIYLVLFFDEPIIPVYAIGLACVIVGGLLNSFQKSAKK